MANFHFICGSDDFLVQRRTKEIWTQFCADIPDENSCEIIDGQAGNADEVETAVSRFISAIQTISLFGDAKAVWFKNITFMADSVTGRSEGTAQQLEIIQKALEKVDPSNVKVILSASPVDRRKKAFKSLQKASEFSFLEGGANDTTGLAQMLQNEADTAGVKFAPGAQNSLIEKLNGNTRLALLETEKLITYLGSDKGVITTSLINELVPNFGEGDFFESVEAFYSADLNWTLEAIRRHFFAGYDARPMIASLQNRNRLLLQLKALQVSGKLRGRVSKAGFEQLYPRYADYFQDDTKSAFNIFTQNPYYLNRLAENIGKFSLRQLIQFQEAFLHAFREIISRNTEQESVMREMAIQTLAKT